jgi:hypothetical protein
VAVRSVSTSQNAGLHNYCTTRYLHPLDKRPEITMSVLQQDSLPRPRTERGSPAHPAEARHLQLVTSHAAGPSLLQSAAAAASRLLALPGAASVCVVDIETGLVLVERARHYADPAGGRRLTQRLHAAREFFGVPAGEIEEIAVTTEDSYHLLCHVGNWGALGAWMGLVMARHAGNLAMARRELTTLRTGSPETWSRPRGTWITRDPAAPATAAGATWARRSRPPGTAAGAE